MKCKNCGHVLDKVSDDWYKEAKKYKRKFYGYFHKRGSWVVGCLGFRGRKQLDFLKKCHCGCNNPEPEKEAI